MPLELRGPGWMRAFAALCLGSCSALVAQAPSENAATVRQALAKGDATAVAWAACKARELGDKQLANPLLEALASWRQREHADSRRVCLHLLDALVGLQPKMPATEVVPLLGDPVCGVAAFVLVAREPLHNEAQLLAMFRNDWVQVEATDNTLQPRVEALGTLLAAQRVPGLAAQIAQRVNFDLELVVTDGGTGTQRSFFFSTGREDDGPIGQAWPPYPMYHLRELSGLKATGRQPVPLPQPLDRLVTRELCNGHKQVQSFTVDFERGPTRWPGVDWLCEMAGLARRDRAATVSFTEGEAFVADAKAARETRRQLLATLKEKLVANGAMTAAEAKVFDQPFAVTVTDRRGDRGTALPTIPE